MDVWYPITNAEKVAKRNECGNECINLASLWVQIWGAPFDMVSPQVASEVGGKLDIVEEAERSRQDDKKFLFMRVHVALPITKPIWCGGFIEGSDGERTWVNFKYERLPLFCHFCGLLGHGLRHCASHFAMEKNNGAVEY